MWRKIKLETIANLALIVTCTWVGYVLYVRPVTAQRQGLESYKPGETISIQDVDLKEADATLLMFIRSGCVFCTDSMPFYSRLTRELRAKPSAKTLRVVVVTTDDAPTAAAYVQDHAVQVDAIVANHLPPSKVRATPTLLLVTRDGHISNAWTGRLPQPQEEQVRKAIGL